MLINSFNVPFLRWLTNAQTLTKYSSKINLFTLNFHLFLDGVIFLFLSLSTLYMQHLLHVCLSRREVSYLHWVSKNRGCWTLWCTGCKALWSKMLGYVILNWVISICFLSSPSKCGWTLQTRMSNTSAFNVCLSSSIFSNHNFLRNNDYWFYSGSDIFYLSI